MSLLARAQSALRRISTWRDRRRPGALGAYYRDGGNEKLVENLPLRSLDLVVDAGGYIGEWSDEILCRYGCRVVVLEPVPTYAHRLSTRYQANDRVKVVEAAASRDIGHTRLIVAGDGSSIFRQFDSEGEIDVQLVDIAAFLGEFEEEVGCLKLNIEGAEYDVLERLLESNMIPKVKSLLIQFHKLTERWDQRRANIKKELAQTHICRFDYPFVWERWDRK